MAIEIKVPRLGWSMEEGTFAGWLKQEGEFVRRGDALFALEGDKSTQEVESVDQGILAIPPNAPRVGDLVLVGQVLGFLKSSAQEVTSDVEHTETTPSSRQSGEVDQPLPDQLAESRPTQQARVTASPRARRKAEELGVDLAGVSGTGRTGRIRERDVMKASTHARSTPAVSPELHPHSQLRRTIAERMVASHQATAPVTLTTLVDASNLVNLREQFRKRAKSGEPIPSYSDFMAKLVASCLLEHPRLNASWDERGLRLHPEVHIAFAVDTDQGLLAPVIRNVRDLSIREVAAAARTLVEQARGGRLREEQMTGGTFTLTNLGAFGIDAFTPIINPPQCAILGMGRISLKPAMSGNQVVPREEMTLSLTFDHRIVDGGPAARFLRDVASAVENPAERLID